MFVCRQRGREVPTFRGDPVLASWTIRSMTVLAAEEGIVGQGDAPPG
jgi:hypothetical protein